MIVYNLDRLKHEGINALRMITECMKVVSDSETERDVKQRLENFIFDRFGFMERHWHQNINVFVAGAKVLKRERDAVISALNHITNCSSRDYVFRVKTYEDFDRSLSNEGRQKEYNDYISNDAEYAIFILDSAVGGITMEEFEVAMNAYRKKEVLKYLSIPVFQTMMGGHSLGFSEGVSSPRRLFLLEDTFQKSGNTTLNIGI